jgi:hypothetical protein
MVVIFNSSWRPMVGVMLMTKMARESSLTWISVVLGSAESSREDKREDDCPERHKQTSRGTAVKARTAKSERPSIDHRRKI